MRTGLRLQRNDRAGRCVTLSSQDPHPDLPDLIQAKTWDVEGRLVVAPAHAALRCSQDRGSRGRLPHRPVRRVLAFKSDECRQQARALADATMCWTKETSERAGVQTRACQRRDRPVRAFVPRDQTLRLDLT